MAAEHVARELVEQEDRRKRLVGRAEEMLWNMLALLRPELFKARADFVVECRVRLPPIVPAVREPEIEDGLALGMTVGQPRIRVAPLIGRPNLPFSIR